MYRCYYCRAVSKPREKLRRHITVRRVPVGFNGTTKFREEIATERPCCVECKQRLDAGKATESSLLKDNSKGTAAAATIANVPCVVGRKDS